MTAQWATTLGLRRNRHRCGRTEEQRLSRRRGGGAAAQVAAAEAALTVEFVELE